MDSIFYGYPPDLIAHWCRVSLSTARDWKTGRRSPSRPGTYLFTLHAHRRILSGAWAHWRVWDGKIWSPDGVGFEPGELESLPLVYQRLSSLARRVEIAEAAKATHPAAQLFSNR